MPWNVASLLWFFSQPNERHHIKKAGATYKRAGWTMGISRHVRTPANKKTL
jgi:hypothetical protein